jgi:hypothetical protein
MYKRITHDEYYIMVNYIGGWEHELTELTLKDAKDQVKTYRQNCNYPVKWIKVRVKNEPATDNNNQ